MICGSNGCGCAIQSSTLSVTGSGTPEDPWVVEQAEFTDITALEAAVDALEAWRTTAEGQISALQTSDATQTASIARLDAMVAGSQVVTTAVGPTSGTTQLIVNSLTVGPFGSAGTLVAIGSVTFDKTVSTDRFEARLSLAGSASGASYDGVGDTRASGHPIGAVAVTATGTVLIELGLVRDAGTGTATTIASSRHNSIRYIFIPS